MLAVEAHGWFRGNLGRIMADPPIDPVAPNSESLSPAEAYARFRQRQSTPLLAAFADGYPFAFDDYQREACAYVEAGSGVLVAAPTGAGKTIVGEFAVFLALSNGRKCFYTTPIKALSNQKYADLVRRHGAGNVGLLTGDTSVNSEAPIVVMTTEVLRNMIYARSSTLADLGYVVLDEVHYLADRFRGAVWEEVIIGLADSIQLVALSATVSNAEEFGEWLSEVRGQMAVVVSERRPVPLYQHVLVGPNLHDLFAGLAPTAREEPGEAKSEVNPALIKIAREESRFVRDDARRPRGKSGRGRRSVSYGSGAYGGAAHRSRYADASHRPRSLRVPSRPELVELLDDEALLPAIVFIFSRVGCDAAVRQLLESGVRLTTPAERQQIAAITERRVVGLSDRRSARARLSPLRRGSGQGSGRASRRHAAHIQGVRGGSLRTRSDQGRLRHGDLGVGHQHARSVSRAGKAGQVRRRNPCRRDARGVHPADWSGGPSRNRR